jgi:glycosyltransferase 2 family protein
MARRPESFMVRVQVPLPHMKAKFFEVSGLRMATPTGRKLMFGLVGLALGAVCFFWAARNVDFVEAKSIFKSSDWRWIVTGIVLFGADLLLRALRWRVILSHRQDIEYSRVARGLFVGYAVNILLPARLGELFRADYTARLANAPRSAILASIFIERLVDLFMVVTLLGIGLTVAGIQNSAIYRVIFVGVIALGIGILLIGVTILRTARSNIRYFLATLTSKLLPEPLASRAMEMSRSFANLIGIVQTRQFAIVLALTIPVWVLEASSVFSICRAISLTLTPVPLMVLLGGASLSTLFPTAPGFVGSYQFAFVLVLSNFDVPETLALVAATSVQLYLMGFYSIWGLFLWGFAPLFWSPSAPRIFSKRGVVKP